MWFVVDGQKMMAEILTWDAERHMWTDDWFDLNAETDIVTKDQHMDSDPESDTYGYMVMSGEQYAEFKAWWENEIDAFVHGERSYFTMDEIPDEMEYPDTIHIDYWYVERKIVD